MEKTLIVYASRYGSTAQSAKLIARVLGPCDVADVEHMESVTQDVYSNVVLMSGIYKGGPSQSMLDFIEGHAQWLETKKVAVVSASLGGKDKNNVKMTDRLTKVAASLAIGGLEDPDTMNEEDRSGLEAFYIKMGGQLLYKDTRDIAQIMQTALNIKMAFEDTEDGLTESEDEKAAEIERFIMSHTTCSLATASVLGVRNTPLGYSYIDGIFYFVSEGGEKFAHMALSDDVSLCIYDEFEPQKPVRGLQVSGKAKIFEEGSDEQRSALLKMKLDDEAGSAGLNCFAVIPDSFEFLASEHANKGLRAKQVLVK